MEIEEREPHAKRGRGNTGDALTSSMAGFRQGAGHRQGVAHFRTSTGSRDKGQSAAAKFDYINREGKYEKGRDELGYTESGNLPEWAKERPREYWEAADKYERDNGRLFVHAEFALPRELTEQQQIALVQAQAQAMARTKDGKPLPYSFAIHSPKGRNPHFHIEISERALDGKERTPETWFKRAPIGAKKTTDLQPRDWVFETRVAWCDLANRHLEREGINTRLDPRTLKAQGIDRIPEIRVGYTDPKRPHIRKERQERNEAIKLANRLPEAQRDIAKADAQIAELTAILRDIEAREKAAALVKAQEQKPEPPRQVQDRARPEAPQQKHTENHAPKAQVAPRLDERWLEWADNRPYPDIQAFFDEWQAKAQVPAPTLESVLAKSPDFQKALGRFEDAQREREYNAFKIESLKREEQSEAERFALVKKEAGLFGLGLNTVDRKWMKECKERLKDLPTKIKAREDKAKELVKAEAEANEVLAFVQAKELAPGSATRQQLTQELAAHEQDTANARWQVQALTPYVAQRKARHEQQQKALAEEKARKLAIKPPHKSKSRG